MGITVHGDDGLAHHFALLQQAHGIHGLLQRQCVTDVGLDFAFIGTVTQENRFVVKGIDGQILMDVSVHDLKAFWKKPFGELI